MTAADPSYSRRWLILAVVGVAGDGRARHDGGQQDGVMRFARSRETLVQRIGWQAARAGAEAA